MLEMKIYFDMDGTIADLYGVDNWLDYLTNRNPYPYIIAKPMINMSSLARIIHRLQREGFEVGIISWLAKNSTDEYDKLVRDAKMKWLKNHLPSVEFDEIHIVEYGTPKQTIGNGILFDDEEPNRTDWNGFAYDVNNIINDLKYYYSEDFKIERIRQKFSERRG